MNREEAIEILQEEHNYCLDPAYVLKAIDLAITGFPWRDCLQSIVTLWMPLPTVDKDNHVPAKAPNEPLPCKIDDDVYINLFGRTLDATVISISELASTPTYKAMYGIRLCYIFKADDVGRTVFLTREAAEEALKAREQE